MAKFLAELLGCTLPDKGTSTVYEVGDCVCEWYCCLTSDSDDFFWKCLQVAAGLTFQLVYLFSTEAITRGGGGIQGVRMFFCLVVMLTRLAFLSTC